jgi:nitrilase
MAGILMKKIAVAQVAPVLLDKEASIAKAVVIIEEAARAEAQLVVLPECFIPGYPTWSWRLKPGADMAYYNDIHDRLLENSVDVSAGDLSPIQQAAKECSISVSIGMNEREGKFSRGTIFNSNALISHRGELLNLHRKLMPTNPERMIHGIGDARGLRVIDTPVGRVGVLICWESYMPLARYSLYAQGVDLYLAPTWDSSDIWQSTLQHIAREGGCYVVGVASCIYGKDIPMSFPHREQIFPDENECINPGKASVYAQGGRCISEPQGGEERLFYVEIDPAAAANARRSLDAAGHYSRSDIFQLEVIRHIFPPIKFHDD